MAALLKSAASSWRAAGNGTQISAKAQFLKWREIQARAILYRSMA